MLIVLSPAKTLDLDTPASTEKFTQPDFIKQSTALIKCLKTYSPVEISSLMRISDSLAVLNANRYASWTPKFTQKNAKQAILTFNGDVYDGLNAPSLNSKQIDYLQSHLRILSGLYGLLRPLDLIQAYRLEMGTKLATPQGKDLYAFWGTSITETLNAAMLEKKSKILINLASEEYFKSVKPALLAGSVITPVFEDWKNGRYKIISFFAKRARGLMARYAALHQIKNPEKLKAFNLDGYSFHAEDSNERSWIFRRHIE